MQVDMAIAGESSAEEHLATLGVVEQGVEGRELSSPLLRLLEAQDMRPTTQVLRVGAGVEWQGMKVGVSQ